MLNCGKWHWKSKKICYQLVSFPIRLHGQHWSVPVPMQVSQNRPFNYLKRCFWLVVNLIHSVTTSFCMPVLRLASMTGLFVFSSPGKIVDSRRFLVVLAMAIQLVWSLNIRIVLLVYQTAYLIHIIWAFLRAFPLPPQPQHIIFWWRPAGLITTGQKLWWMRWRPQVFLLTI